MIESRTNNTVKNFKLGIFNFVSMLILNFSSRTIFIRVLGAGYLGINGLFSDILTLLSMADLGLGTAMAYSFYRPLAENDRETLAALVKFYKGMYSAIAVVVALTGLVLVPFLGNIVKLTTPIPYIRIYYLFFLANTVISYLYVYKMSIINAAQKNYLVSQYQVWVACVQVAFQCIFLIATNNYFIYLAIQALSTLASNLIVSWKADQLFPYVKKSQRTLLKSETKGIFENIKSVFIYRVSGALLNGTDNIIISIIVGTVSVGLYSNYNIVISSVNSFVSVFYSSAVASVGNAVVTEKPRRRFEIFRSMQTLSLLVSSLTTVCLFTLFNDFIHLWLGHKYMLNDYTLEAVMLNFYIGGLLYPIWTYREATGIYIQTKYIMLIAAIMNIWLSVVLGKYIGMAGVFYATAIVRLSTYFWYEPRLLFKGFFEESVIKYYVPLAINSTLTAIMILIFSRVSTYFTIDSWFRFSIKALTVLCFSLATLIITYRRTIGFKELSRLIARFFVRKAT